MDGKRTNGRKIDKWTEKSQFPGGEKQICTRNRRGLKMDKGTKNGRIETQNRQMD